MKVWIAFCGYDDGQRDILGVFSSFDAAQNRCIEEIDGDIDIEITIQEEDRFFAEGMGRTYRVSGYRVE